MQVRDVPGRSVVRARTGTDDGTVGTPTEAVVRDPPVTAFAASRVVPRWWLDEPVVRPRRGVVNPVPATQEDGRLTVRVAPDATPGDLRRVVSLAASRPACHTVALDLDRIPRDAVLARAIAATRVRLLVRGLRVELVHAPADVVAAVGPDAPDRYRVVDGPAPRRRTGAVRPAPRGRRGTDPRG
ncbi:hypothetical protein [Actinomycetospora chiangmaiensis]|uniref:hypothetical protein n=1 Tax=Actinomycetospora chiangmaiensis TaxID=402650 RepID=UPI00036913AB|nr:hypothetical protein [Actinomycetospora chiangmaiensis]